MNAFPAMDFPSWTIFPLEDLVLTNELNLIGNIEIQAPLGAGDHDIISFSLIVLPSHLPDSSHTTDPVRNFAKCNFDVINSDLDQVDWDVVFSDCTSSDDYWTTFLTVINKSIDLHCPRFPLNFNSKRKRFVYPSEIKRLQAFEKRAWRRLRANKLDTSLRSEYKIAADSYRDAVNNFHYNLESSILSERSASSYYKFIRGRLNRKSTIPTLVDELNIPIDDPNVKTELFNNFFASVFTADDGRLP